MSGRRTIRWTRTQFLGVLPCFFCADGVLKVVDWTVVIEHATKGLFGHGVGFDRFGGEDV
jgi:hypothetical protein